VPACSRARGERGSTVRGRNVLRDADLVATPRPALLPLQAYLAEAAEILAAGPPTRGRRRRLLAAAVHDAIDFHTWRSLAADQHVTRTEAAAARFVSRSGC
jgi:hypothetical protein